MMFLQVVLATVFSGLVAVWLTARLGERVPPRFMQGIVIFAAGVLLAIAIFELLPHGLETLGEANTLVTFVIGLLFFLLVSRLVSRIFGHVRPRGSSFNFATPEQRASLVPVLLLGDGIHSAVGGVLIALRRARLRHKSTDYVVLGGVSWKGERDAAADGSNA